MPKAPPRFTEGERAILGGLLLDPDAAAKVIGTLDAEDFYTEAHRICYAAIQELFEKNQPADYVTLTAALKQGVGAHGRAPLLEQVGGVQFLTDLVDAVPSAANILHYATLVKDKAVLRRLISAGTEVVTRCYEEHENVDTFLDDAEQLIFKIRESRIHGSILEAKDLIKAGMIKVETLYDRKEYITGVASGFKDLDKLTAGFQNSDLIIIAGRPSMGKTSLALDIALNAAMSAHPDQQELAGWKACPTLVFSLEMSSEQIALRLLCARAKVNLKNMRSGYLTSNDWAAIALAAGGISEAPLYTDDTAAITALEIRAKARRVQREHGLGLVVIDYLQLMSGRGASGDSREREISEISRSLKALAKELNVPVIALSQLNRKVEERTNKRPQLADLRESGAIEQDADVIIFIYRDEVYNKSEDNPKRGLAEVIVGKQRNGPIGTVEVAFKKEWSSFMPLSHRGDEGHAEAM